MTEKEEIQVSFRMSKDDGYKKLCQVRDKFIEVIGGKWSLQGTIEKLIHDELKRGGK